MARYTGSRDKINRRFGQPIFGPSKALERRNFPPGVHGAKGRRKQSDFAIAVGEKQKMKYWIALWIIWVSPQPAGAPAKWFPTDILP